MSRIKPWALEELGAGVVWRLQMTYFTEKARWQFFAQEFCLESHPRHPGSLCWLLLGPRRFGF